MSDNKLKPCPFCGGKAKPTTFKIFTYIWCRKCGAATQWRIKIANSIKAWNRRCKK